MMGHAFDHPCSGKLSEKATELGRARVLLAAERLSLCPFCAAGWFAATGTAGRLACPRCGSIALDGRKAEARPIEGKKAP
jgi:ribosomal protein S27AE